MLAVERESEEDLRVQTMQALERNGCCCCFLDFILDSVTFTPMVPSLKSILFPPKLISSNHLSLNLYFPIFAHTLQATVNVKYNFYEWWSLSLSNINESNKNILLQCVTIFPSVLNSPYANLVATIYSVIKTIYVLKLLF